MRFLLIGDTHGKLGVINELAARTQANAVIHAGDKRSHLGLSRNDRIAAAKETRLVGEFQSRIDEGESFRVPVYAVYGKGTRRDLKIMRAGNPQQFVDFDSGLIEQLRQWPA